MAGSMACEYVSLCTKVLHVAYTHVCHGRRMTEKRFFGKVPGRKRLEGSLYSHAPSNRKNVITERIKVRETTSVTRLRRSRRRRPRPDAEFKYRRKYSAFDSRNCCIRHLFALIAATQRLVRCCRLFFVLKGDERVAKKETKELSTVSISLEDR